MTTSQSSEPIDIRLAIVVPYGGLDTIPFLCDLSEYLASRGYRVDIFEKAESGSVQPNFSSDRIRVLPFPESFGGQKSVSGVRLSSTPLREPRPGIVSRIPGVPRARRVVARIRPTVEALDPTRRTRWRRVARLQYRVVIGVDAEGLLPAASLSGAAHAALVYYSLELLPSGDLSSLGERTLKRREARLSRAAALVIVQDPSRGRILEQDNGIDPSRFVYAPNAPTGAARRAPSKWWHELFDLPSDRKVLLHAGGVGSWTGIDGLVEAASDLPDDWVLVVHSHDHGRDAARIEQLRTHAPAGKVFFSDSSVTRQQYRALIDGADAGVAFYIPEPGRWTMANLTSLGLASGKFSYYLWCGLPVVVNSATSLGELVEQEGVGIRVESAVGVGEAVRSVTANYRRLSDRAVEYFDSELDFAASAERIGAAIDGLARVRR